MFDLTERTMFLTFCELGVIVEVQEDFDSADKVL